MVVSEINEYTDSYIAFLDIIGFKMLLEEKTCTEIIEIFQNYRNPLSDISIGTKVKINLEDVQMKVISDSVCFHIACEKKHALVSIITVCQALAKELLWLSTPTLIRGAVVRGNICQNGDFIFGAGLVDAIVKEKEAKYPRIVVDNNIIMDCFTNEKEKPIHQLLFEKLYKDRQGDDSLECVDYMELAEGLDVDGTIMPRLHSHTLEQIDKFEGDKREKWEYLRMQILKYYKPKLA